MFLVSNKEMLLACAEAGILGAMPTINQRRAEDLEADLAWLRRRTDRPFALNLTLRLTHPERLEEDIRLCEAYRVPVWITSYGDPTPVVRRARAVGARVFHDVIHAQHARKAHAAGVDAIIGVAAGAGGHAGTLSPLTLTPYLKRVTGLPVLAAGAISTGAQWAAVLALGADLAYVGTRFIASTEAGAPAAYKQLLVDAGPEDVVYTDKVSGVHANFLRQTLPEDWSADRSPDGARRWRDIWSAGHGVADIQEVKPIGALVEDLVREYHDAVRRLA